MAVLKETKPFIGGMDKDTDIRFLENGKFLDADNIRVGMSVDGRGRVLTNMLGVYDLTDTSVNTYNAGTCIGMFEDEKNNDLYLFYADYSASSDRVVKYDIDTDTFTQVIYSASTLNLSASYPILAVSIIEDLVFFTDGYNPPRRFNRTWVNELITTEGEISVIKSPPYAPPSTTVFTDSSFAGNNIKDRFFQFKYRYVYDNNEKSVYSPISAPAYSELDYQDPDSIAGGNNTSNAIRITVSTANADSDVSAIEIVGREGNTGDFKFITKIDPTVSTQYTFYNNAIYASIPLSESNQIYDDVPQLAYAQAIAENRLIYGNVKTGYDKIDMDYDVEVLYASVPTIGSTTIDSAVTRAELASSSAMETMMTNNLYTPSVGDTIRFTGQATGSDIAFGVAEVKVTAGWSYSSIYNEIMSQTFTYWNLDLLDTYTEDIYDAGGGTWTEIDWYNTTFKFTTIITGHERTYKSGSWYDVGVQYFDKFGRTNGAQVDYSARAYIQTVGERTGGKGKSVMKVEITNIAPSWAEYFTIVYSRATTVQDSVYCTVVDADFNTVNSSNDRLILDINSISLHHDDFELSTLAYSFEPGDRVRFITIGTSSAIADTDDYATSVIDAEIISSGTDYAEKSTGTPGDDHLWIEIATPSEVASSINHAHDALIEIYTPGKVIDADENILFETTKFYTIDSNGYHGGDLPQSASSDPGESDIINSPSAYYIRCNYNIAKKPIVGDIINITEHDATDVVGNYTVANVWFTATYIEMQLTPLDSQTWTGGGVNDVGKFENISTGLRPGVILLDNGDAYYRTRQMYNSAGVSPTDRKQILIESYSIGDFSNNSQQAEIGRPTAIINQSQQTRFATCFYSEAFIPNTEINNLNRFYPDVNFEEYGRENGAIWKLYKEDDGLLMIQESKVSKVLVNRAVTYDASGASRNLQTANVVLSTAIPYQGEFGIQQASAQSFASHGGAKYWVDLHRGMVIRLSRDGITPISEYGMKGYFRKQCKLTGENSGSVIGFIDPVHNEYRVAFTYGTEALYFAEDQNGWISFIPFYYFIRAVNCRTKAFYHTSSDFLEINRTDVSNGQIKDRNSSLTTASVMVQVVSNSEPTVLKNYMALVVDGNSAMNVTVDTEEGQQALTFSTDFVQRETELHAPIFRDVNTPNVTYPAISGDTIKGKEAKIKLEKSSCSGDFYIKTLGVIISKG